MILSELKEITTIHLNAMVSSTLQWTAERSQAFEAIAKGKRILWQLDFGLFNHLTKPIQHSAQFLTLGLAIDHFTTTIWEEFHNFSLGASLYYGSPDFSLNFPWDEEQIANFQSWLKNGFEDVARCKQEAGIDLSDFKQFTPADFQNGSLVPKLYCRDVCSQYLKLLSQRVPDRIPRFVHFEVGDIKDPLHFCLLTAKDCFEGIDQIWDRSFFNFEEKATVGICLPSSELKRPSQFCELKETLNFFKENRIPCRLISENHLTSNWDGLDYLLYSPLGLSPSGRRKLLGFNAASGVAVSLGEKMDLPLEISFAEFKSQLA